MAKYMLLLNQAPDEYDGVSQEDMMAIIAEYVAWVDKMTAEGRYQAGSKLAPEAGRRVTAKAGDLEVHDSPFTEAHEILGGYMIIEAEDYDHALELVRDHPHLKYERAMEIRRVHEA